MHFYAISLNNCNLKNLKKTLFLLLASIYAFPFYGQDLQIISKNQKIEVKEDSSFTREITIKFKKSNTNRVYSIFYDSELEEVSDIKIYKKKKKRVKEIKVGTIIEENVNLEYIASKKIKTLLLPKEEEIHLKYKIHCKELMYFSDLRFFSYDKIDSLKYQIKLPKQFRLSHKTIYKDSLNFFSIDSSKTVNSSVWNINVVPKKVTHDPLQFFGIYKNMKVPLMRVLVSPSDYQQNSVAYMNDWYYKNIISKRGLNDTSKQKIDELTTGVSEKNKILDIIYNYVKKNFKYVAIEVGMGAFIPSHANEVFKNKQGDCKDLSNFLSEALNYKGIKSDIALAATFDHISDCDFPSLSSANHVICVAYLNNTEILLDPTDPIHQQETPVQTLQGRSILIINSKGGKFLEVKQFTPPQNSIKYQMSLKVDSKKMLLSGNFDIKYDGISDNYLQRLSKYETETDFNDYINSFFKETFGNQGISNLTQTNISNKFNFLGNIEISGKTFNDDDSKYLFLDFAPKLIENENRENLLAGTYIGYPFQKTVVIDITLDESIVPFKLKNYNFNGKGISLNLIIKSISDNKIQMNYDFIFDHIFIDENNISDTNKLLKAFKKIINDPIILKRKKA